MKFTTPVTDFGHSFQIEPQHRILTLGSCFADVVGKRLTDYRLHAMLNPFGTLYNPKSILSNLNDSLDIAMGMANAEQVADRHLFQAHDSCWYSWTASSVVRGESQAKCRQQLACILESTASQLKSLDVLILTFGTDHYYELQDSNGLSVANCHKMAASLFEERVMSVDDIVGLFGQTFSRLKALRHNLKVIFTVSPYRYAKYGLHQSKVSKARLLLAIDQLQSQMADVYYFPAYEIVNDELRDYRFYASDMMHPSEVTGEYIWQKFCDNYMSPRLLQFFKEWTPILKALAHKPASEQPMSNLPETTQRQLAIIRKNYPELF